MRITLCFAFLVIFLLSHGSTGFCDESLTNIRRPERVSPVLTPGLLTPGTLVRLPDGRQTRITEILPEGIRTELGVMLTPEGAVLGSAETGTVTLLEPGLAVAPETLPENTAIAPETAKPETGQTALPAEPLATRPGNSPENSPLVLQETPAVQTPKQSQPVVPSRPETPARQLTIAELLPLTPTPDQAKAEKSPAREDVRKAEPVKPDKAKEEKTKVQKPAAPAKPDETPKKPRVGEELRIPPEAVRTGNLDFLEGCWQGTRPEYYSKRMVKECFCFGPNGSAGKRRVIDPKGGRTCIGSTKANLSQTGVLSVTSSGAACTDGERWGQAEMVCKGSGQRTPCSWIFKDAGGGSQAYEIPFVRVESCGR